MKDVLKSLSPPLRGILRSIGDHAQSLGYPAYVVGGCVRDLILKRQAPDLDIVIEGDAIAVARQWSLEHQAQLTVFAQFKTATVVLPNGCAIDFACARREQYPYPGALPVVARGTIKEDLFRRDLTINALAASIHPQDFGRLIDHYGGLKDLQAKVIRVLHEKSFIDDPTRILRAVRFEQRFCFHMESKTLRMLRAALKKKAEVTVKPQRYFEEFKKNLNESKASDNIHRLSRLGALDFLGHPFRMQGRNVQVIQELPNVCAWACTNLPDYNRANAWVIYMMVMCDGASHICADGILKKFSIANVDKKKILSSLDSKDILGKLTLHSLTTREIFKIMRPLSVEELLFLKTNASGSLARVRIRKYLLEWRHLKLAVNGDDLKRLGIPAGRLFKFVLDELLFAMVEGRCMSRNGQLNYAQDLVR